MEPCEVAAYWEANAESWTRFARAGYDVYRDALNTPAFLAESKNALPKRRAAARPRFPA